METARNLAWWKHGVQGQQWPVEGLEREAWPLCTKGIQKARDTLAFIKGEVMDLCFRKMAF